MRVRLRDVRNLVRDSALAGARRPAPDGPFLVPAVFLVERDGHTVPLPSLRGSVMQLTDGGFTADEAVGWLLAEQRELGTAPIRALLEGRVHEVRRVAQALAL